jgi:hypothetical protein
MYAIFIPSHIQKQSYDDENSSLAMVYAHQVLLISILHNFPRCILFARILYCLRYGFFIPTRELLERHTAPSTETTHSQFSFHSQIVCVCVCVLFLHALNENDGNFLMHALV